MYQNTRYFGYELKKSKAVENDLKKRKSFAAPDLNDGAINIEVGESGFGFFSNQYVDVDGAFRNEQDLIRKYRETANLPEVDDAIEQIVNEAIVTNEMELPVSINLDNVDKTIMSENVKKAVVEEFEYIIKLLSLKTKGHEIFKNWYIDGKLYYHKIIDENTSSKGIRELRPLDPTRTKKIREVHKKKDPNTNIDVIEKIEEYYLYMPEHASSVEQGYKISPDAITYCPSGLLSTDRSHTVGYLYKAIRPANQLKMMEDALVIYRLARAPERRVFYIDVGSLPKAKAEQYVESLMRRYKNKLVYEATTGEVRNDRNHMSMLEDYWLPRRDGQATTEIDTIGGGANLGEIEDIVFFQRKLLKSMNVPISRLESDNNFSLGRASEITRDELKFNKFINRLRSKFSEIFYDTLGTQLVLKKIIKKEEWEAAKKDIFFDYLRDSHFTEMKDMELLSERLDVLSRMENYIDRFFSDEYVMKKVLHFDDKDIDIIKKQQEEDKKNRPEEDGGGFGGGRGRF